MPQVRATEKRSITARPEVRRAGDIEVIEGYAARFYDGTPETEFRFGGVVERIDRGAFDKTLKRGDDVVALFNHDENHILGRRSAGTLRLRTDDRGLHYEIDIGTHYGDDLARSIGRGDIDGSSFQFVVRQDNFETKGGTEIRELRAVDLIDVGPVVFPAYAGTSSDARMAEIEYNQQVLSLAECVERTIMASRRRRAFMANLAAKE